jgi:hypothetical protein
VRFFRIWTVRGFIEKKMSTTRELLALQSRIRRLQKEIEPPTLRMVQVYDHSKPEAAVSDFTMALVIEDRLEWTKKDAPE